MGHFVDVAESGHDPVLHDALLDFVDTSEHFLGDVVGELDIVLVVVGLQGEGFADGEVDDGGGVGVGASDLADAQAGLDDAALRGRVLELVDVVADAAGGGGRRDERG